MTKQSAAGDLVPRLDVQVATDLLLSRSLVYDVTTLTGKDGRRRTTVTKEMASREWGVYDVHMDTWTLDPSKVLRYLANQYGPKGLDGATSQCMYIDKKHNQCVLPDGHAKPHATAAGR